MLQCKRDSYYNTNGFVLYVFSLACLCRLHPRLSYETRILFKNQLLLEFYGNLFTPSWVYLHNTGWRNHTPICIFFYQLCICLNCIQLLDGSDQLSSQVWQRQPGPHAVPTADALRGQLWVYGQGQNCLPCHLLCLTFKMMKRRESDLWQDLFKEQPLGNVGGPDPGSMLGDWSAPYSKAKYRKPSQRRRPYRTWSHPLLWSSLQYLSCFTACINMPDFYVVKLFSPFPLLSSLLLDEQRVALLQMER